MLPPISGTTLVVPLESPSLHQPKITGSKKALHEAPVQAPKSTGKGLTEFPRQVGAQVRLGDITDMLFEKLRNCGIPHLIQLPHSLKKTATQDIATAKGDPPRTFPCIIHAWIYTPSAASCGAGLLTLVSLLLAKLVGCSPYDQPSNASTHTS